MLKTDTKEHYKMYKSGKQMVNAMLLSALIVTGGLTLSQTAKADTVGNASSQPTVQTTVNSAQSTTDATPQSMPTQSAVPTQSPAADVNTANSAPTAQPVSAQPVSNNQTNSASNVSNQTPTTTLNVQPVQPAQRFAATSRANLYVQRLAQTNQQSTAQNVSGSFKPLTDDNSPLEIKMNHPWAIQKVNWSFDVTADQLHAGQPILIGYFYNTYHNDATNGQLSYAISNGPMPLVKNGTNYGTIEARYDWNLGQNAALAFWLKPNTNVNVTGIQHFTYSTPQASLVDWLISPANFQGANSVDDQLQMRDPNGKVLQQASIKLDRPIVSISKDKYQYTSGSDIWFDDANSVRLSANAEYDPANINGYITYSMHVTNDPNNPFIKMSPKITFTLDYGIRSFNSSNEGMDEFIQAMDDLTEQATQAADGLSIAQLEAQNIIGIQYSRQADGSYNIVAKIKNQDITNAVNKYWDTDFGNWKTYSWARAQDSNPDQATTNTANHYKNDKHEITIWFDGVTTDSTEKATLTEDIISGNAFHGDGATFRNTLTASNSPIQLMASGQSAVKLHVINAQNGADLVPLDLLQCKAKG